MSRIGSIGSAAIAMALTAAGALGDAISSNWAVNLPPFQGISARRRSARLSAAQQKRNSKKAKGRALHRARVRG